MTSVTSNRPAGPATRPRGRMRWFMLALVMLVTCLNYLDRANLSIAAPLIQKEYGLDPATLGLIFSAFGWSYMLALPFSGVILDKIGPRLLYSVAILGWSVATIAVGLVNSVTGLIGARVAVGLFEAPALPTNVHCVTAWHPDNERAFAVGAYTAMQYVAAGFLTPVLAWILVQFGWREVFYITGALGFLVTVLWAVYYREPKNSRATPEELAYISGGGGLSQAPATGDQPKEDKGFKWSNIRELLSHRQVWGMFVGQFSVQTTLFFFITWFPTYLINGKGMTVLKGGVYSAIPFLVAVLGALLGGKLSGWMLQRGMSNTVARKAPVIAGFLLSAVIIGANYTSSINLVIVFMSIAFFGQAMASTVTGALLSDIAPRGMIGTLGGILYFVANAGGTLAPIVVGFIVKQTGGFNLALGYVSFIALLGVLAYLFVLGPVYRIEIKPKG